MLAQAVWTRDAASLGKRATRKTRPITEKESQKWLASLEAVKAAHAQLTLPFQEVTLRPPRHRTAEHLAPVPIRAVWALEAAPPPGCTVLLDPDEWQALYCVIHRSPSPPTSPPTLRQAIRWITQLGGFLARASDGEPGPIVLWRGFQHLADHTTMNRVMKPAHPTQRCG